MAQAIDKLTLRDLLIANNAITSISVIDTVEKYSDCLVKSNAIYNALSALSVNIINTLNN